MNRSVIILVFAFICFCTSCQKDEGTFKGKDIIEFAVNTPETKGTPSNDVSQFSVYGYYIGDGAANNWITVGANTDPIIDGLVVNNSGSGWGYGDPIYWPAAANANVSFFAYTPVSTSINGISVQNRRGTPTLRYSVPTDVTAQPDLMVAVPVKDKDRKSVV